MLRPERGSMNMIAELVLYGLPENPSTKNYHPDTSGPTCLFFDFVFSLLIQGRAHSNLPPNVPTS